MFFVQTTASCLIANYPHTQYWYHTHSDKILSKAAPVVMFVLYWMWILWKALSFDHSPLDKPPKRETKQPHDVFDAVGEHSPKAAAPGGWGPTAGWGPPGVGGTGLGQDLAAEELALTTPTYSTKVPGKSPFSLVLSLMPCSQPLGLRSSPSWYSSPAVAISEALGTVSRSPGCRLMSSPRSRLYSKSARYWKLSDAMAAGVHRRVPKPKIPIAWDLQSLRWIQHLEKYQAETLLKIPEVKLEFNQNLWNLWWLLR